MNDIILSTQNGEPVASSRQIAESFEKNHRDVLRAIDSLKEDVRNFAQMFFETDTPDSYGRPQRTYLMTRDGFTLLAMGFTGKAALEWKLKYIAAFNAMEKELAAQQLLPVSKEMQALFLLDQRTVQQEARLTALENTMTVDYSQQQALKKAVGRVVVEALGGKEAPAYCDPHVRGKLFSECNRDVQDWFRVNSVCNVPRKDFDKAVEYIQRWKPSTNSVMLIQSVNAQTSLYG